MITTTIATKTDHLYRCRTLARYRLQLTFVMDTFKSIAGTPDSDDADVQRLLEFYDNDINNALAHYFEQGFEGISLGAQMHDTLGLHHRLAPEPPTHNPSRDYRQEAVNLHQQMFQDGLIRLPKAPSVSNNWQLDLGIHRLKRDLEKYDPVKNSTSPWWVLLLIIPRLLMLLVMWIWQLVAPKNPPNRLPKLFDFEGYIESYDPELPEELEIVTSDFDAIYKQCQLRYQWLIIVLVNDETAEFGQKLVALEWFKDYYGSQGTYAPAKVYFGNVSCQPEAHAVGTAYGCRRLPFIAAAANVLASPAVMPSMLVVYKLNINQALLGDEAHSTIGRIGRNLGKIGDTYNAQLVSLRYDLQEIEYARVLKEQQDQAYADSLAQDREKKAAKQAAAEQAQKAEKLKRQRRKFMESLTLWRELVEGKVSMAIRLPLGQRQIVKLAPDVTVQELYLYIESLLWDLREAEETEEEDSDVDPLSFSEYFEEFPFTFEVVQPFPKQVVAILSKAIEEEPVLKSGANLLVEYLALSDDENDTNE